MDWMDFYLGGVVASNLLSASAILYTRGMKVGEVIALIVMSQLWPVSWIIAMILAAIRLWKTRNV